MGPLKPRPVRIAVNPANVVGQVDERIYGHFLEHIYHSVNGGPWLSQPSEEGHPPRHCESACYFPSASRGARRIEWPPSAGIFASMTVAASAVRSSQTILVRVPSSPESL